MQMKKVIFVAMISLFLPLSTWAVYDLPDTRRIAWQAGSDIWNGGALPNYPSVTCSPLYGDGVSDDTSRINACITAAAANTAVYLPAGNYYVAGTINLKSRVVLRGAGSGKTILIGTPKIQTPGGSTTPALAYNQNVVGYLLSGTPQKGDTTVTLVNSFQANIGDWISIGSDNDPSFVTPSGTNGNCNWCGENSSYHLLQQFVQVINKSGSVITLSKPLYFTPYTTPQFKKYSFGVSYAGVEDLRMNGTSDMTDQSFIFFNRALFSWVKGVETYNTGSNSSSAHVRLTYSYGCEVRDSYFHGGRSSASGANYGIWVMMLNSDHKFENNILRHNRHSFSLEGGGVGCAFLYNYADDNYSDDLSYLGSSRSNHGAHPYMNLWEGNTISHITADNYWGSSSNQVFFRNWVWGDETGIGVPSFPPYNGYVAIDVWNQQNYYSHVGNVLGITGMRTNWSNATVRPTPPATAYPSANAPIIYGYGSTMASSTSLNHGNYDYKTQGVAYWEGGTDHTLKSSMYYGYRPSYWCSETPWPPIGPDVSPVVNPIPSKRRNEEMVCTGANIQPPPPPESTPNVPNAPITIQILGQ